MAVRDPQPLAARIEALLRRAHALLDLAFPNNGFGVRTRDVVGVLREVRETLELLGRATGELRGAQVEITLFGQRTPEDVALFIVQAFRQSLGVYEAEAKAAVGAYLAAIGKPMWTETPISKGEAKLHMALSAASATATLNH